MFHFPGYGIRHLCIQCGMIPLHGIGLLHSETSGSKLVCSSPKLIAAYRVLHRLPVPRHPSCALSSLTTKESSNTTSRLDVRLRGHHARLCACSALRRRCNIFPQLFRCQRTETCLGFPAAAILLMVGVSGFEPETSSLSGTRSNQLSYTPYSGRGIWWS